MWLWCSEVTLDNQQGYQADSDGGFTRALFGLGPSPFLLGGTITQHIENSRDEYPEEPEKISPDLYEDDLITGNTIVEKVKHLKETAT